MAKGNLILGNGSGSIGDVTMMRRNGAEVARVRLRKIKNPKSQGQAEQRMYMAPILKFYSPLAKVLETSFEGLNRADSYAKFISINSNLARANQWAVKKGTGFVPLPYQISQGTIESPSLSSGSLVAKATAAPTKVGELSTAIIAKYPTLQNGDQLTYIYADYDSTEKKWTPKYGKIILDTTSTADIPTNLTIMSDGTTLSIGCANDNGMLVPAQAFIFSRWDGEKWARSTSFMWMDSTNLEDYTGAAKLAAAIASYMKGAGQTPVSDVYLNGSDE